MEVKYSLIRIFQNGKNAEQSKKKLKADIKVRFEAMQKGNKFAGVNEDGEEMVMPEITYRKSSIVLKNKNK